MSSSANNSIPFVPENTIDPAAGLNESINTIDALLQLAVLSVNSNAPPATPAEGDRHIVGPAPTGAWSGKAGKVARFLDGYWSFYTARLALNLATGTVYIRNAAVWAPLGITVNGAPSSGMAFEGAGVSVVTGGNGTATITIPGRGDGQWANAAALAFSRAFASGKFATIGDTQSIEVMQYVQTEDAIPLYLAGGGGGATLSASSAVHLPPSSAFLFKARVLAKSGTARAAWLVECLVYTGAAEGSIAIEGTPVITPIAVSSGAASWAVAPVVLASGDLVALSATGAAATPIRWVAHTEVLQLAG